MPEGVKALLALHTLLRLETAARVGITSELRELIPTPELMLAPHEGLSVTLDASPLSCALSPNA